MASEKIVQSNSFSSKAMALPVSIPEIDKGKVLGLAADNQALNELAILNTCIVLRGQCFELFFNRRINF